MVGGVNGGPLCQFVKQRAATSLDDCEALLELLGATACRVEEIDRRLWRVGWDPAQQPNTGACFGHLPERGRPHHLLQSSKIIAVGEDNMIGVEQVISQELPSCAGGFYTVRVAGFDGEWVGRSALQGHDACAVDAEPICEPLRDYEMTKYSLRHRRAADICVTHKYDRQRFRSGRRSHFKSAWMSESLMTRTKVGSKDMV